MSAPTKKPKKLRPLSVNSLADSTGLNYRTVRKILVDAGLFPPEKFPRADVLNAVKPKGTSTGTDYKDREQYERWRKLKLRNDRDEGTLVPRANVIASLARRDTRVDQILEQKLANEYPSAVAGLDVPQARIYGKRLADQIRVLFKETAKDFY